MADYVDYHGCQEPEEESPASAQFRGGRDSADDPERGASPQPAEVEVESLKRKLALYQEELDAVHRRAAAIERESQAAAESVRREAEAKAQEIIRRAKAEAELLELRARVRTEEMRARGAARFWACMEVTKGDGDMAVPDEAAPLPSDRDEREVIDGAGMAEEAEDARTSPVAAEGSQPDDEDASTEPSSDVGLPVAEGDGAVGSVTEVCQHDDQRAVSGDQPEMAEEAAGMETSEVAAEGYQSGEENIAGGESDSGLASAAPSGDESVPDATTQSSRVDALRYRVKVPLNPDSMAAMEEAAGRINGVVSAKMDLGPDGGAILTVFSRDPQGTELAIRQLHI